MTGNCGPTRSSLSRDDAEISAAHVIHPTETGGLLPLAAPEDVTGAKSRAPDRKDKRPELTAPGNQQSSRATEKGLHAHEQHTLPPVH